MTIRLLPAPLASPADLVKAQQRDMMVRSELARVRSSAASWRTGLAGLLGSLAGFSLIKGRADFTTLAHPWPVIVGILLAISVVVGAFGAYLLMRATGGHPSIVSVRLLKPRQVADHMEALAAARALRRGIAATFTCAMFLIFAVATSWYAPGATRFIEIRTDSTRACGTPTLFDNGALLLKAASGDHLMNMMDVRAIQAVGSC